MMSRVSHEWCLLDESLEGFVDDVFEVGEKAVDGVSEWRFGESEVARYNTVFKLLA